MTTRYKGLETYSSPYKNATLSQPEHPQATTNTQSNNMSYPLFAVPTAPTPQRSELVLQIRAQTAAEGALEKLRTEARTKAELAYANGPGRKRYRGWETLPESDPVFRREKKTRSAYVSRFKAKEYEQLLERSVADSEELNEEHRMTLESTEASNNALRAQIRALQTRLVEPVVQSPPPVEPEEMGSPLSLSPLSTSHDDEPVKDLVPFSLDSMVAFTKFPHVLEEWSADEADDQITAFSFL